MHTHEKKRHFSNLSGKVLDDKSLVVAETLLLLAKDGLAEVLVSSLVGVHFKRESFVRPFGDKAFLKGSANNAVSSTEEKANQFKIQQ